MENNKLVTLFGGSGFVGQAIKDQLITQGYKIRIAGRSAKNVEVQENVEFFHCDYTQDSINEAVIGSFTAINLIGILFEKGKDQTFQHAHVEMPKMIAKACTAHDVKKFIHISALGINESSSKYAASKISGETSVKQEYSTVTILRPSIIFGEDDSFFNMFEKLSRFLPILPLIGGGHTKFQPVYVRDIALAIANIIEANTPSDPEGNTYHIGGPTILSFKEVYQKLFKETNRKRFLIPLPWPIATAQARLMELMPTPMLTRDQVESLKTDNIIKGDVLTLKDLNATPTNMDTILSTYLGK